MPRIPGHRLRLLPVVAGAGAMNLLLLCAPVLLLTGPRRLLVDPPLAVFLLLAAAWFIAESLAAPVGSRPIGGVTGPRWLPLAIGLAILATWGASLVEAALRAPGAMGPPAVVGAALMAAGAGLRVLALRTLGRFFLNEVAVLPGQPLVTHGVYGWVRHPSETGTVCLAFGAVFLLGSWVGWLIGVLLLLPGVLWRTRLEDRLMRGQHPAGFRRYAREVPAFIPRLRRLHPAALIRHNRP